MNITRGKCMLCGLTWGLITAVMVLGLVFLLTFPRVAKAQPIGCYQIDRFGALCIPSTGEIFVDTAGGWPSGTIREPPAAYNLAHQKLANDSWIDRSTNPKTGERCCDAGRDCFKLTKAEVTEERDHYVIPDGLRVHKADTIPSEDGEFWVCFAPMFGAARRIRCFFTPYSGS
jgi:hypothetical protein